MRPGAPDMNERPVTRRRLLQAGGALAALAVGGWPTLGRASGTLPPQSRVARLYRSLSEEQRAVVCFPFDHQDPRRGLLRHHACVDERITEPPLTGPFYSADQRAGLRAIFDSMVAPDWRDRLQPDRGGDSPFGDHLGIAIFGDPTEGPVELVLAGRHLTLRCDGEPSGRAVFTGPIVYGLDEGPGREVPQALAADGLADLLDDRQRRLAMVSGLPGDRREPTSASGPPEGLPIRELSRDQRQEAQRLLRSLLLPLRTRDRDPLVRALREPGGLDACSLALRSALALGLRSGRGWNHVRVQGPGLLLAFRAFPTVRVRMQAGACMPSAASDGTGS